MQGECGGSRRWCAIFRDQVPSVVEEALVAGEGPGAAVGARGNSLGNAATLRVIDKVQTLAGDSRVRGGGGGFHADQAVFGVPVTVCLGTCRGLETCRKIQGPTMFTSGAVSGARFIFHEVGKDRVLQNEWYSIVFY